MSEMVEKVGCFRVPETQRWMGAGTLFNNWLWIGIYPLGTLQGLLFAPLGLYGQILANIVIFATWFFVAGAMAEAGRRTGAPELILGRIGFGWVGNAMFSILLVLTNLGWFGMQTEFAATTINTVYPIGMYTWLAIIAVVMIAILAFGIKGISWFNYVSTAIFLIVIGYIVYVFATSYTIPWGQIPLWPDPTKVAVGALLTSLSGWVYVGWAYKFPAMTRFAKPYDKTKGQFQGKNLLFFSMPLVALLIANIPLEILGTISYYAAGDWNALAVGLVLLPSIILIPAVIAIGASMINTNVLNLYPGIMQVLSTIQSLGGKAKSIVMNQLLWTIILSILGAVMAYIGMIGWATSFTSLVSAATGPFAVIIATDLYLIRKFKVDIDSLYCMPKLSSRAGFDLGGVAILLLGALITYYFDTLVTYPINMFPGYLLGAIITFVVYYAYRKRLGPNGYLPT